MPDTPKTGNPGGLDALRKKEEREREKAGIYPADHPDGPEGTRVPAKP